MWLAAEVASIVDHHLTEEDTAEGCESTKEVGLPGNGALSHVDISGSLDALGVGGLVGHVVVAHVERWSEGVGRRS